MAELNLHNAIIKAFPLLKDDPHFSLIGKPSPDYNCIAYAANKADFWYWPIPEDERPKRTIDGVIVDWPEGLPNSSDLIYLVKLFEKLGFSCCKNHDFEEGFKKVALYKKGDQFTHAARQLTSGHLKGIWSSKLGDGPVITHEDPFKIEGITYGQVYQILKKSML